MEMETIALGRKKLACQCYLPFPLPPLLPPLWDRTVDIEGAFLRRVERPLSCAIIPGRIEVVFLVLCKLKTELRIYVEDHHLGRNCIAFLLHPWELHRRLIPSFLTSHLFPFAVPLGAERPLFRFFQPHD